MRELGWVEGRNIIYDNVYADNDVPRLPTIAAELVARAPDLIWTMLLAPPGGDGTTMRTGRSGYVGSAACATVTHTWRAWPALTMDSRH